MGVTPHNDIYTSELSRQFANVKLVPHMAHDDNLVHSLTGQCVDGVLCTDYLITEQSGDVWT